MAIDTTPSQVATNALQALPFGNIIGGRLKHVLRPSHGRQDIMEFHSGGRPAVGP